MSKHYNDLYMSYLRYENLISKLYGEFSVRDLADRTGYTYSFLYHAVHNLEDYNVIKHVKYRIKTKKKEKVYIKIEEGNDVNLS